MDNESLLPPAELEALEKKRQAGRRLEPWEVNVWTPDEILGRIEQYGFDEAVLPWDWPQRLLAARMRLKPDWAELWVIARTSALMVERPDLVEQPYFRSFGPVGPWPAETEPLF